MAITFESEPNNYNPSGNPITYVFSSDQTGQANFSFKVETILNGSVVSEDRVFVEVSNRAHFDCSPVVINLLQKPRLTTDLETNMDTIYTLQLRVTELYGDPVAEEATLTSATQYTIAASLPNDDWKTFTFNYLNNKWLTDVPNNTFKVIEGQDVIASILTNASQSFTINFYDSSEAILDTYVSPATFYRLRQLNLSDNNLLVIYGGSSFDDVASFDVQVGGSEVLTFIYVEQECYNIHSLVWLNKYGTFDQYPIEHNVTEKTSIESRSFKKKYGSWVGDNYLYDFNNAGDTDFEKTMTDNGSLVTNYMNDVTQNWFVSAYESPQAYLYDTNGLQYRLRITGSSYTKKKGRFDDLIMEELEYSKSMNRRSVKL